MSSKRNESAPHDTNRVLDSLTKFNKQDYDRLRASCSKNGQLFVDDLFLPNDNSLLKSRRLQNVQWKRPHELVSSPRLFVDEASSRDVNQGSLGNCWFVAALSVLASEKKVLCKVVPDANEQTFDKSKNYAGIFRFRFWQFGRWIEIVVDDLLPTINNRLIFTHSSNETEFWSSLLEKAYAKLNGCYEHLDGGNLSEALQDFTGGICESIQIGKDYEKQENLFDAMKKAFERNSLLACAINVKSRYEVETKLSCGLIKGHAYGITKIVNMNLVGNAFLSCLTSKKDFLKMIRLKNPWGKCEWRGAWSDNSSEWKQVPKNVREKMGLNFDDDGEFWMELGDFLRYFNEVSICRNINTSVFSIRKTWNEGLAYGKWQLPERAGGCVNYKNTFCLNPQYMFEINSSRSDSDEILFNLDQLSLRHLGKENRTIGFFIMRVEDNRRFRLHRPKLSATASSIFINTRSVFLRERLKNGKYVIIPSTFEPSIEGVFLLRIYSDENNNLKELKKDFPKPFLEKINPFAKKPSCVTSLWITFGTDLLNPEPSSLFDTYLKIKCESEIVQSKVVKNSTNPHWNTSAIFYRHRKEKPIKIEVWLRKALSDQMYGYTFLDAEPNNRHILLKANLVGFEHTKGRISLEIQSMSDYKAL